MAVSTRIKQKQDQAKAANMIAVSDGAIGFSRDSKRTVKFQFEKTSANQIRARVISPFHSAYYGACAQGPNEKRAVKALRNALVRDFGYIGRVLLGSVDDADNVGIINPRLIADNAKASPISMIDACGSAGQ